MDISLTTLLITAPTAGAHAKNRKPSQQWAYRHAYRQKSTAKEREHGAFKSRGRLVLLDHISVRSQSEVARILGDLALSKIRRALLGLYGELTH